MDVDGGNRIRLTNNSYRDDLPTWSSDGTQITFINDAEGDGREQVYVIDADGSNQRRVTFSGDNTAPYWSPDGTEIVFQSRPGSGDAWRINLIKVPSARGRTRQLTPAGEGDYVPTWSPDSGSILFYSYRDSPFLDAERGEERRKGSEIYIMNRSGGNPIRISNNEAWDALPAWAPRKAGVEVSEASIVIPNASRLEDLRAVEVTASAASAVVRIETDSGSGSGFVIDSNGLILTNNHVILDADEINVFLKDGTQFSGTVRGRDLIRDLAVVQIEANNLPLLEFTDLGRAGLGTELLLIGFPLGSAELTISRGLVSAIKHDVGRNVLWVQTDAVVTSGSSGGPLVNLKGEVIGLASNKFVGASVEGFGFAISANTIKLYLERLKSGEDIKS